MGNPLYMTREELAVQNSRIFANTNHRTSQSLADMMKPFQEVFNQQVDGYNPGYRSDIDYTSIQRKHRTELVAKDIEIAKLKKEIEDLKAQIEIINSPTLII